MYFDMTFQYEGIILIIALKVKIGEILGQIPTCRISDLKHHLFDFTYLILESFLNLFNKFVFSNEMNFKYSLHNDLNERIYKNLVM